MSAPSLRGPAVVTGGAQGLGRAFCLELARLGVDVVVADLQHDGAERVAAEVRALGQRGLAVRVDVTDEECVEDLMRVATDSLGPPAILVNNAAVFSTLALKPMTEISTAEWRTVMDVNVTGTFLCCRAVLPLMKAEGYGKIINISSATIWTGRAGYLHYVTSKAALIGFTRSLASEVGADGIRVNAITPGSTETEVDRATISHGDRLEMAENTALKRVQTPDDLVGAVGFLASPASDFITGQTINVDGGLAFH